MAAKHIRVLLPRNTQADHDVEEVGGSVLANVHNNKNFTALPVDQPMLQAALTDFTASIAATAQGGSQATNEKPRACISHIPDLKFLHPDVRKNLAMDSES